MSVLCEYPVTALWRLSGKFVSVTQIITVMEVIYRSTETLKKLENNPRTISEEQLQKLKESIQKNPDYFEARPIILSDRTGELVGSDFRIYEKGIEVDKSRELRGSSFQVSVINERTALRDEYIEALRYEFTLPLPNNRRWDLDKEILPVFEKL